MIMVITSELALTASQGEKSEDIIIDRMILKKMCVGKNVGSVNKGDV